MGAAVAVELKCDATGCQETKTIAVDAFGLGGVGSSLAIAVDGNGWQKAAAGGIYCKHHRKDQRATLDTVGS